jgi:nucleoside-diphosphate-sugar epimerase
MRVLVVGGAGYVGGAVTDLLAATEHEVLVYDALFYEEAYRKQVPFVRGDVLDQDALAPHLEWADSVIWLAALVGDGACALNPEISEAINHQAVRDLARRFDGRIVFTSTCSVYGAHTVRLTEESPTKPLSVYASTKLAAEHELSDKNAVVFRLGTLFGVGDHFSRIRLDLVVNTLTVKAATIGRIVIFGGDQYRPLLHVRDAAAAIVHAALSDRGTGLYNLHSVNIRITELAALMQRHFPALEVQHTGLAAEDARDYRVSSAKAEDQLGFVPERSVDDGIDEVRGLVTGGRIKDVNNPRYSNQAYLARFQSHMRTPVVSAPVLEPVHEPA